MFESSQWSGSYLVAEALLEAYCVRLVDEVEEHGGGELVVVSIRLGEKIK